MPVTTKGILFTITVSVILTVFFIFGLINHEISKYKNKNIEYFVTNQRVAIYKRDKKLVVRSIFDILYINIAREKDGYGVIDFICSEKFLFDAISFYGVKDVRNIAECVCKINPRIRVNDDRLKIMGRKL